MHVTNIFNGSYDFDSLVISYPSLAEFVFINDYNTKTIHFADNRAVKALNAALLKHYFSIDWDLPSENLCPPIPGRLDYLLNVSALINAKNVTLLDIGTGANLIYPILATCHLSWKCSASDIDDRSLQHAHSLIEMNPSLNSIQLRKQTNPHLIFENTILSGEYFDIVVCNPPFFKNQEEAQVKNLRKVHNLKLATENVLNFGGISNELWCPGGELEFIKKMMLESLQYKNQVSWFTSLVSSKDNLKLLLKYLHNIHPKTSKVLDMGLGNKKTRCIVWSFSQG